MKPLKIKSADKIFRIHFKTWFWRIIKCYLEVENKDHLPKRKDNFTGIVYSHNSNNKYYLMHTKLAALNKAIGKYLKMSDDM